MYNRRSKMHASPSIRTEAATLSSNLASSRRSSNNFQPRATSFMFSTNTQHPWAAATQWCMTPKPTLITAALTRGPMAQPNRNLRRSRSSPATLIGYFSFADMGLFQFGKPARLLLEISDEFGPSPLRHDLP